MAEHFPQPCPRHACPAAFASGPHMTVSRVWALATFLSVACRAVRLTLASLVRLLTAPLDCRSCSSLDWMMLGSPWPHTTDAPRAFRTRLRRAVTFACRFSHRVCDRCPSRCRLGLRWMGSQPLAMATAAVSCTSLHDKSYLCIFVRSTACLDFSDADENLASVASKPAHRCMSNHCCMVLRVGGNHVQSSANIGSGLAQCSLRLAIQAPRLKRAPARLQLAPARL